mmetsp:Transcript_11890/g.28557  ORF Transcript_11890/g.28557 Transcript_11890/m.28557 type:complete len:85 (-) Transcript_11890:26-280(-)
MIEYIILLCDCFVLPRSFELLFRFYETNRHGFRRTVLEYSIMNGLSWCFLDILKRSERMVRVWDLSRGRLETNATVHSSRCVVE